MVTVGEPAVANVCVIREETVFVNKGVGEVEAADGVNITCNVNAAEV
jgi:hypothetical protein